jgi:hypothetical protein
MIARAALAASALCLATATLADEPALPPMPKTLEEMGAVPRASDVPPSMEGYGEVNPTCLEWSDGCQTCRAETSGAKPACSTVAIACKRAAPSCAKVRP